MNEGVPGDSCKHGNADRKAEPKPVVSFSFLRQGKRAGCHMMIKKRYFHREDPQREQNSKNQVYHPQVSGKQNENPTQGGGKRAAQELHELRDIQEDSGSDEQACAEYENGEEKFLKQKAPVFFYVGTGPADSGTGAFLADQDVMQKERIAQDRNADQEEKEEIQRHGPQPFADQVTDISWNLKRIWDDGEQGYRKEQDKDKVIQDNGNGLLAQEQAD